VSESPCASKRKTVEKQHHYLTRRRPIFFLALKSKLLEWYKIFSSLRTVAWPVESNVQTQWRCYSCCTPQAEETHSDLGFFILCSFFFCLKKKKEKSDPLTLSGSPTSESPSSSSAMAGRRAASQHPMVRPMVRWTRYQWWVYSAPLFLLCAASSFAKKVKLTHFLGSLRSRLQGYRYRRLGCHHCQQ